MRLLTFGTALGAVLLLFACGGGGGGSPTASAPEQPTTVDPAPTDTEPTLVTASGVGLTAPIVDVGGRRHIGADVAPTGALVATGSHDGIALSHGTIRDGAGSSQIVAYLQAHLDAAQAWGPGFEGLPIHRVMPTVHLMTGASDQDRQRLLRALQVINTALPHGGKLVLSDRVISPAELGERSAGGWFPEHPDGTILIEFGPLGQGQVSAAVLHPKAKYDDNDQLYLSGSHSAPWKGAITQRVQSPPGNCRSSR